MPALELAAGSLNEAGGKYLGTLAIVILVVCVMILVIVFTRLPMPDSARSGYALADGDGHALRFTQDTATNRAGMSMSGNELPIVSDAVSNYERLGELNQEYADSSQEEYLNKNLGVNLSSRSGYKPYRAGMKNLADPLMTALNGGNIKLA
jgi:hypothetical protein